MAQPDGVSIDFPDYVNVLVGVCNDYLNLDNFYSLKNTATLLSKRLDFVWSKKRLCIGSGNELLADQTLLEHLNLLSFASNWLLLNENNQKLETLVSVVKEEVKTLMDSITKYLSSKKTQIDYLRLHRGIFAKWISEQVETVFRTDLHKYLLASLDLVLEWSDKRRIESLSSSINQNGVGASLFTIFLSLIVCQILTFWMYTPLRALFFIAVLFGNKEQFIILWKWILDLKNENPKR